MEEFVNLAASAQFTAFVQIQRKFELILSTIKAHNIPISKVHVVGGVSCNQLLKQMIQVVSKKY